jgi:cobalamin synthase
MKDSAIGAYGAIGLVLLFLAKVYESSHYSQKCDIAFTTTMHFFFVVL